MSPPSSVESSPGASDDSRGPCGRPAARAPCPNNGDADRGASDSSSSNYLLPLQHGGERKRDANTTLEWEQRTSSEQLEKESEPLAGRPSSLTRKRSSPASEPRPGDGDAWLAGRPAKRRDQEGHSGGRRRIAESTLRPRHWRDTSGGDEGLNNRKDDDIVGREAEESLSPSPRPKCVHSTLSGGGTGDGSSASSSQTLSRPHRRGGGGSRREPSSEFRAEHPRGPRGARSNLKATANDTTTSHGDDCEDNSGSSSSSSSMLSDDSENDDSGSRHSSVKRSERRPGYDADGESPKQLDAETATPGDDGTAVERQMPTNSWINPLLSGCRGVQIYRRLNKISEGTYGAVFRAEDKVTKEILALKHIKYHERVWEEGFPMTSLREIFIMLALNHVNIVNVREVVVGDNPNQVFMVMEYVEHELKKLLQWNRPPFALSERKTLLYQLLSAVEYLHKNWIMHRDLKTSNLLYSNKGILKVCDFGMARRFGEPIKPYTHNVVTLWYRAPELLLGQTNYTEAIDLWSVGCIMGELMLRKPLFRAANEVDALDQIFRLCGTPTEETWPGLYEIPHVKNHKIEFTKHPPSWRSKFPVLSSHISQEDNAAISEAGLDLLKLLLTLDPAQRISAASALKHPFFTERPLPQRTHLMPSTPDTNKSERRQAASPRGCRDLEERHSSGGTEELILESARRGYTFGSRVDAKAYLSELDTAIQQQQPFLVAQSQQPPQTERYHRHRHHHHQRAPVASQQLTRQ